jgi:hypothetical protein
VQIGMGPECVVISSLYPALWEWLEVPHCMLNDESVGSSSQYSRNSRHEYCSEGFSSPLGVRRKLEAMVGARWSKLAANSINVEFC